MRGAVPDRFGFGETGAGCPVFAIERGLEDEVFQGAGGVAGIDGHLVDGGVVVEVDAEGAGLGGVADVALPAGVIAGADRHVGIAAGGGFRSEGDGLRAGGRDDALELAAEGGGFLERELADFIAAGGLEADVDFVDAGGEAAVGIGDADVNRVAGADGAGAEGGLGGGKAELLDVEAALAFAGREGSGGEGEEGIRSDADDDVGIGGEVFHLRAEAFRVAEADLVVAEDLQDFVVGGGWAEGGGHIGAEFLFAVAELVEEDALAVAGFRPDFHFDVGTDAGDVEGGVAEIDLHDLAGDDDGLVLRRAEFDLAGLDEFAHLVVDFSAQDEGVGVLRILAEDLFDFLKRLGEAFLIHQNLGAGVADFFSEILVGELHQVVELGHGGAEIFRDAIDGDGAEGGC